MRVNDTQSYQWANAPLADLYAGGGQYAAIAEPGPRRQVTSNICIVLSLAVLVVSPVINPEWVKPALVLCFFLCAWDPRACIFLLIASQGAYYQRGELVGIENLTQITPTRIISALMFIRILIKPGLGGLARAISRTNRLVLTLLVGYFVAKVFTSIKEENLVPLIGALPNLVMLLIALALVENSDDYDAMASAVLMGLLLPALYYIPVWMGALHPAGVSEIIKGPTRINAANVAYNFTATLLSAGAAGLVLAYMTGRRKGRKIYIAGAMALLFMVLLENASCAGLVGTFVGAILAAYLTARLFKGTAVLRMFGMIVLAGIVMTLAWGIIGGRFEAVLNRFYAPGGSFRTDRFLLWAHSVRYVIANPLGDRPGWFAISDQEPHNTFISAGVNNGWLGLICLVGLVVTSVVQGWRSIRSTSSFSQRLGLVALFVVACVTYLTLNSISAEGQKVMWFSIAVLAMKPSMHLLWPTGETVAWVEGSVEEDLGYGASTPAEPRRGQ